MQAELATARIERLLSKGQEARAAAAAEGQQVFRDLLRLLESRVEAEVGAGDALVAVAEEAVARARGVPLDWRLAGDTLHAMHGFVLVAPTPPSPEPQVHALPTRRVRGTTSTHVSIEQPAFKRHISASSAP